MISPSTTLRTRHLLITLLLICMTLPAGALANELVLAPGEGRQVVVDFDIPAGSAWAVPGDVWFAQYYTAPPLAITIMASFPVIPDPLKYGRLQFTITPQQTRALSGTRGRWAVLLMPAVGKPRTIAKGALEITK